MMNLWRLRCTQNVISSTAASAMLLNGSFLGLDTRPFAHHLQSSTTFQPFQHDSSPIHPQRRYLATTKAKARNTKPKPSGKQTNGGGRNSNAQHQRRGRQETRPTKQGHEQVTIRPPKNYLKGLPKATTEIRMPPAMLAPTASPYVYIAQTALLSDNHDDTADEDEPAIDTSMLFSEVVAPVTNDVGSTVTNNVGFNGINTTRNLLPPLFAKGDFEYFSPERDLGHEYPVHGIPEVAFLGRSNVGKSSLINALMRRDLCITSKSPGRTQLPYYYGLIPKTERLQQQQHQQQQRDHRPSSGDTKAGAERKNNPRTVKGYIIDLPGYGFGNAPKAVVEEWQQDTQNLLLHRRFTAGVLQRLFLLMDARRGGPNELDRTVMRWLEDAEIPYTIVLTKADRVSVPLVVRQVNDFCLRYASLASLGGDGGGDENDNDDDDADGGTAIAQSPVIHVTSATRGWGIHELMLSVETEFFAGDDDDDDVDA